MNVTVELTDEQVSAVVRVAALQMAQDELLSGLRELSVLRELVAPSLQDPACSTATLRAVLVYCAFPVDGGERAVTEVADELGLLPSTVHRYVSAWMVVGLLVQDPRSRRYRRAAQNKTT